MMNPIIPISELSSDFCRGLEELLDREDLSWIQGLAASDLDCALLAYRHAAVTIGLERFARELRKLDERFDPGHQPCEVPHPGLRQGPLS